MLLTTQLVLTTTQQPTGAYPAVARSLSLLEALCADAPQGVSALAQAVKLDKGLTSRLLAHLAQLGYVEQDGPRGQYRPGPRLNLLARSAVDHESLVTEARPLLEALAASSRSSVSLAVATGGRLLIVASVISPERIAVHNQIGAHAPAHASALGKVLLAHMDRAARADYCVQPLRRYTANTITRMRDLERALVEARQRGYALETGEEADGVGCIGAPIFDSAGRCIAAISASGPLQGTAFALDESHITQVIAAAEELSARLGYHAEELEG